MRERCIRAICRVSRALQKRWEDGICSSPVLIAPLGKGGEHHLPQKQNTVIVGSVLVNRGIGFQTPNALPHPSTNWDRRPRLEEPPQDAPSATIGAAPHKRDITTHGQPAQTAIGRSKS